MNKILSGTLIVTLLGSLIANGVMYFRYSTGRPLITMGQTVITRKEYRDALEAKYGKEVLRKLVLARLVKREAEKAKLYPTAPEVDARIQAIEAASPTVIDRARMDPVAMWNLRQDTATDIALERLRMQNVTVTDREAEIFFQKNPNLFTRPMQVETTTVMTENAALASSAAEMLRQGITPYVIARQPGMYVSGVGGFRLPLNNLAPAEVTRLQETMSQMKPGDVRTVPVMGNFLTFRIKKQHQREQPPFEQVKDEAVRLARIEKTKSPQDYLLELYRGAHPVFEANRYADFFREYENSDNAVSKSVANVQTAQAR